MAVDSRQQGTPKLNTAHLRFRGRGGSQAVGIRAAAFDGPKRLEARSTRYIFQQAQNRVAAPQPPPSLHRKVDVGAPFGLVGHLAGVGDVDLPRRACGLETL